MIRHVALTAALVLGACAGDGDTDVATQPDATVTPVTTATTAAATGRSGQSPILVASGSEIVRVDGDEVEVIGEVDGVATIAFGDGVSGIQVVEVDGTLVALLHGDPMQLDPGAPGTVFLYDLENIDGVPHALYGVLDDRPDVEPGGPLLLRSITGDGPRDLGTAFAIEFTTVAGSIGGGLVATSAYSDLTESVDIRPIEGDASDEQWTPTTGLAYNEPPLILAAMLAPDGATVAWLSGPDASGIQNEPEQTIGTWEVVVADLDGNERHRLPLDASPRPVHLDYDGARLLVSREGAPALLIELDTGEQRALTVAGTATFDG